MLQRSNRTPLPTVALALLLPALATAQAPCTGATTLIQTIGAITYPPAVTQPIALSYSTTFTVPADGVYEITGQVTTGIGIGGFGDFTNIHAEVAGHVVIDEDPPPIDPNSLPNGWNYQWAINYHHIWKDYSIRLELQANTTYSIDVSAAGNNPVFTLWHDREYGISMTGLATTCGLPAQAQPIGTGCGAPPPTLTALDLPILGTTPAVELQAAPLSIAFAMFGADPAAPTPIGSGCTVYADLLLPLLPLAAHTDPTGTGTATYAVPPTMALEGSTYVMQGLVFNPFAPLGFDLTNGLHLTLGY